jgi:hypothetical protein
MPSQILHTLFGEDVIAETYRRIAPEAGIVADKALGRIRDRFRLAFILGCQGPDIIYHSQGRRPVALEYGTLLHRRGAGIFTAGLLKKGLPDPPPTPEDIRAGRREMGINASGVYALGFMTHAILDREAHPFIVYRASQRLHAFFERIIDVLMLERLRGMPVREWDQAGTLGAVCLAPPPGLKALLAYALVLAYPERAGKDARLAERIANAFADCADFYRLTDPARDASFASRETLPLLFPIGLNGGISAKTDFLNLSKESWQYPAEGGARDDRSFPELYQDAVAAAAGRITPVIEKYLRTGVFPIPEAAQAIGNGGLSIVDGEGRPAAPTCFGFLPLEEVLEAEAARRF